VYGTGRAKFGEPISLRNSRGYKRSQSMICPELGKMQPRNGQVISCALTNPTCSLDNFFILSR
jgi:hypothetical protein